MGRDGLTRFVYRLRNCESGNIVTRSETHRIGNVRSAALYESRKAPDVTFVIQRIVLKTRIRGTANVDAYDTQGDWEDTPNMYRGGQQIPKYKGQKV